MTNMVSKINHILSGLTACRFKFQPADSIVASDWNETDLQSVRMNNDATTKLISNSTGDAYGIPVMIHGSFAGLAVIEGSLSADRAEPLALAELLTTVLELRLNSETKAASLVSLEERLRVQEGKAGNVTQMRPTRLARVRAWRKQLEEREQRDSKESNQSDSIQADSDQTSLLIEDLSPAATQQIAIDLHEKSGRWAFLPLEDLTPATLETREGIKSLGGITLFIRDLSALSLEQQIRLAESLAHTSADDDAPRVIAGLRAENRQGVMPHLLSMFQVHATEKRFANEAQDSDPNRARLIPFDLRLLDQDQAPVH